jgi:hypothetical protein
VRVAWWLGETVSTLIFGNGPHRLDHRFPFSRVIEVNPATKKIFWKYREALLSNFYSPRNSNTQRLPNANTPINEGSFGPCFEGSPVSGVAWEYVNSLLRSGERGLKIAVPNRLTID